MFASLNHTRMSIWEALSQFSGLREYEAALFDPAGALLDPDMPLMQHALQASADAGASCFVGCMSEWEGGAVVPFMQHAPWVSMGMVALEICFVFRCCPVGVHREGLFMLCAARPASKCGRDCTAVLFHMRVS